MGNTLVRILQEQRALNELLIENDGILSDEMVESTVDIWIREIQTDLSSKIDQYQYIRTAMESQQKLWAEQEGRFYQARKSVEKAIDRFEERLKSVMIENTLESLSGSDFEFKLSQNPPSVVIDNENELPAIYTTPTVTIKIDKAEIKRAIVSGKDVPGAHLERTIKLRVKEKSNVG